MTVVFAVSMLAFFYVCYIGVRAYFFVAIRVRRRIPHEATRTGLLYAWFLIFALVEVPIAIFFPLWLSHAWNLFEAGPAWRSVLILLGCAMLAAAAWLGWKSKEARQLAEMTDLRS